MPTKSVPYKYIFLLNLIEELNSVGSWCGNTHIQKIAMLVLSILEKNLYDFRMYHYGPFSFNLKNDLDVLVMYNLVERSSDDFGYHYKLTEKGRKILKESTLDNETQILIKEISMLLGNSPTYVLELISTVEYVLSEHKHYDDEEISKIVESLKPHFDKNTIRKAVRIWRERREEILRKMQER